MVILDKLGEKMKKIAVVISLLVIFSSCENPTNSNDLEEFRVQRVIDGDTLELTNGERIRLIGVDAPELNQSGGNEARLFVENKVLNRVVWLEADGNDRDTFGRLRRYVWLQQPSNPQDESQIRNYMLNALLLINNHANVMIVGTVRNEALFRQLESERN